LTIDRREFTYGLIAATALAGEARSLNASSDTIHPRKLLLQWQQEVLDLCFGMYIHLNMATYEQREWGNPKASRRLFNPAHLDTDQWAEAALSAKMKYGCRAGSRLHSIGRLHSIRSRWWNRVPQSTTALQAGLRRTMCSAGTKARGLKC